MCLHSRLRLCTWKSKARRVKIHRQESSGYMSSTESETVSTLYYPSVQSERSFLKESVNSLHCSVSAQSIGSCLGLKKRSFQCLIPLFWMNSSTTAKTIKLNLSSRFIWVECMKWWRTSVKSTSKECVDIYMTPKSYLSFIDLYLSVYKTKYADLNAEKKNIRLGLKKLQEAAQGIAVLKEELAKDEVKLREAAKNLTNCSKNSRLKTRRLRRRQMKSEWSNRDVKSKPKRLLSKRRMPRKILHKPCLTLKKPSEPSTQLHRKISMSLSLQRTQLIRRVWFLTQSM